MTPKKINDKEDKDSGESGGSGGKTGKVAVRVALMVGDTRDEPRTPAERRHMAVMHQTAHADRVRRAFERQKALAATREQVPRSLNERQAYAGGGGGGAKVSPYKSHPISQTAYFSGAEESPIPSDNADQDLNAKDRAELTDRPENKLQNRLSMQQAPKHSPPKPRPY